MIISFYSYKGGVGRSQLCANVAAYLCFKKGKKVLLWDWDFEAPGLHYFFQKNNDDIKNDGTIEMLGDYVRLMRSSSKVEENDIEFLPPKSIIQLKEGDTSVKGNKGIIDLLPGGNYNEHFVYKVNSFNWFEFYELLDGITYIEKVKNWVESLGYDYILIDSRTGINDYSGICNIQLPDTNVIVTAANEQNITGSKRIIEQILNSEYTKGDFRKPYVLPVLSRIDAGHPQFEYWLDRFVNEFSYLLDYFDSNIDDVFTEEIFRDFYLAKTCLEYVPTYSAGENLLINSFKQNISNSTFISKYVNIGDYLDNLNETEDIGIINQISKDSWMTYAENAVADGKREKAALAYTYADEDDKSIELGGTYTSFVRKGIDSSSKNNFDKAIEYYQKALELEPDDSEAFFNIGVAYSNKKEFDKAIGYFQKALEINPNDFDVLSNIGFCYANKKEYDKSLSYFQKALEINPNDYYCLMSIGSSYGNNKEHDKAISYFQKAFEINPNDYLTALNIGISYSNKKENEKAFHWYERAVQVNPDDGVPWNSMGFEHLRLGNLQSANHMLNKAVELGNADLGNMNLGHVYLAQKEEEKAVDCYKKSLQSFADKTDFWNGMNDDFQYLKQYGIEEEYYRRIIKKLQEIEFQLSKVNKDNLINLKAQVSTLYKKPH